MLIKATFFGKTKMVRAEPHNMTESETPDEILWAEDSTDLYALMCSSMKGKKVAIVWRKDWLKAKPAAAVGEGM